MVDVPKEAVAVIVVSDGDAFWKVVRMVFLNLELLLVHPLLRLSLLSGHARSDENSIVPFLALQLVRVSKDRISVFFVSS